MSQELASTADDSSDRLSVMESSTASSSVKTEHRLEKKCDILLSQNPPLILIKKIQNS